MEKVSVTKPALHLQCHEGNGHSAPVHVTCNMMYLNDFGTAQIEQRQTQNNLRI